MTHVPDVPAAAERAVSPHDTRLVTHIPRDVSIRLRLLATLRSKPVSHVLSELLGRELPTSRELAEQLRRIGAGDDNRS